MKDLRFFETLNQYESTKGNFEYPQVSFTNDNGKVWVKESENYFTAILNITEDNINDYIVISPKGLSELHNSIQSIYINDQLIIDSDFIIKNTFYLYKFNEVGYYNIKYILPKDIKSTKLLRGFIGICLDENFEMIVNEETFTIKCSLEELDVINLDTSNVIDMETMFAFEGLGVNLKIIKGIEKLSTSNVTNMRGMFYCCNNLTSLDLSNFDTSNVTDMSSMFGHCSGLTSLDLSNFDTSNVTDMSSMFGHCSGLTSLDLSSFNTSKVTTMEGMFGYCNNLTSLDVSSFNTSKVTTMEGMFGYCSSLTSLDLSNFDTFNVINMYNMFENCTSLISIEFGNKADVSKVTSYNYMFNNVQECTLTLCNNTQESWSTLLSKVYPKPTNIIYIECNE